VGAKAARLSIAAAMALLGFAGSALAQGTVRVDFDLGEGSGSITEPGLGASGYLLLGFDDANPLLADGTGAFTVTTFSSAELHLEGAHPAESDIQQIGSAYQMGSVYGLSLELNNAWSTSGSNYTESFQFSFSTDTGVAPLLSGTSSEFGVFALQQLTPGSLGQIMLNRGVSSELGSTQGDYTYTAAITGVSAVPEPASVLLWLQGLGAVAALGLARKARQSAVTA
jgi:hypothetical protein